MNSTLLLMKSGGATPLGRLLGCSHLLLANFFFLRIMCACVHVHVRVCGLCLHVHGCVLKCLTCVCRCSERAGKTLNHLVLESEGVVSCPAWALELHEGEDAHKSSEGL